MKLILILLLLFPSISNAQVVIPCLKQVDKQWVKAGEECIQYSKEEALQITKRLQQWEDFKKEIKLLREAAKKQLEANQMYDESLGLLKKQKTILQDTIKLKEEQANIWKVAFKDKMKEPPLLASPTLWVVVGFGIGVGVTAIVWSIKR